MQPRQEKKDGKQIEYFLYLHMHHPSFVRVTQDKKKSCLVKKDIVSINLFLRGNLLIEMIKCVRK